MTQERSHNIKKLKGSSVFRMIYTNEERTDITFKMQMQQEDRQARSNKIYYYLNPDGAFLNCLISKSEEQGYTDFLKALKREPQISPDMIVEVFMREFGPEFTKSISAQTLIVFKMYFEFVLIDFQ